MFSSEFFEISKNTFFLQNTSRQLHLCFQEKQAKHIRKVGSETRDFWWDLRLVIHLVGETRDLTRRALKVETETRDTGPNS